MQSKRPSSRSLENHEGPNRRRCCEDQRRTGRRIRTYECHSEFFSWARQVRTCCHPAHELPRSVSSSCQFSSMISLSWEALISRFQVRVLGGSLSFFLQTAGNPESARLVLELHEISLTLTGCLHKKRLVRENVEYFSTRYRN